MDVTPTAFSELTRVLPWSIRALGYSFGVADRAATLLTVAQALGAGVLEGLEACERRPGAQPALEAAGDAIAIEGSGLSLLELGPPTIDLLGARTQEANFLRCALADVSEAELTEALLVNGADYGLAAVAVYEAAGRPRWCALAASVEGCVRESAVLMRSDTPDGLEEALAAFPAGLADSVRSASAGSGPRGVTIFSTRDPVIAPATLRKTGRVDVAECLRRAYRQGIPLRFETLQALYGLERKTWAPSSERSRAQAGFQHPSGRPS